MIQIPKRTGRAAKLNSADQFSVKTGNMDRMGLD